MAAPRDDHAAVPRRGARVVVTGHVGRSEVCAAVEAAAQGAARIEEADPLCAVRPSDEAPSVVVVAPHGERAWTPAVCALAGAAARVVLDADDAPSRREGEALGAALTWTTRDPRNPLVREHLDRGGEACVYEGGALHLAAGGTRHPVCDARALPALLGGAARRPLSSALLSLGAAVALGLRLTQARQGLATLSGPRYARHRGAQVVCERPADEDEALDALHTLWALPAERRLLWRAPEWVSPAIDDRARAAGVELVRGELEPSLRLLSPGDALLVLAPVARGGDAVVATLDRFEAGWGAPC